ncbi:MAG: hypothetical protein H6875_04185 [Hyphomicrobiaceae bacterium]|nr:hypothetical protein [Hyphomicrobiaceae bacterium]
MQMIDWWKSIAYPVVNAVVTPILTYLSNIFQFDIQLSDPVKDYLGVGIALTFSRIRGAFFGWKKLDSEDSRARSVADRAKVFASLIRKPLLAAQYLFRTILFWPIEVFLMARMALFARNIFPEQPPEYIRNVQISHSITLLPIIYFVFLVLASWAFSVHAFFVRK